MSQRYSINLASEPFRRDRPLLAASVALGVILMGLAAWLDRSRASPTMTSTAGRR